MSRAVSAARLYIVNKWQLVYTPLIVIASMIALTVGLSLIARAAGGDSQTIAFNGSFQAVLWFTLGVAVSASTQMFPFAFAMSLRRRDFVLGTLLAAAVFAAVFATLFAIIGAAERATSGWGLGAYYVNVNWLTVGPAWQQWLCYLGMFAMFFLVGFAASMLWKRFAGKGMIAVGLVGFVIGAAFLVYAGLNNLWMSIGEWFLAQTPATFGGMFLTASVVLAGCSYLLIRHAEP